jgi:CheY-like chemotaxis protein
MTDGLGAANGSPVREVDMQSAGIPAATEAPPYRVVVAEDRSDIRRLLVLTLERHGFEAVAAADGLEALRLIVADGAHALVSDLEMPHLSGLALCRALRALESYAMLPVILYTGAGRDDVRLRSAAEISMLRVMHKPTELLDIVPALIDMLAIHDTDVPEPALGR